MELKNEFSPVTKQDWESKFRAELKIKDESPISWNNDQIEGLKPIYFKEDQLKNKLPYLTKKDNNWEISQKFDASKLMKSNKALLSDLALGLEAPSIHFKAVPKQKEWAQMFSEVFLDYISLHFSLSKEVKANAFIRSFHKFLNSHKYKPKKIHGSINIPDLSLSNLILAMELLPKFKTAMISIGAKPRKKSPVVDEIAAGISAIEELIFQAKKKKINPSKLRKLLFLKVSVDDQFFINIAKIRALKILSQNLFEAYGLKTEYDYPIHATSSKSGYTDDQHSNMIRSTIQAVAAVNGGVSLLLLSSSKKGKHSKFTQRVARNLQHIMKMESKMHLVQDPIRGSYFVEKLSDYLIENSWAAFVKNHE